MNVFNDVILARNRQLPDDDRMNETGRSFFKSFNINNLSVCTGWCTDQVIENGVINVRKMRLNTSVVTECLLPTDDKFNYAFCAVHCDTIM